MLFKDEDDAVFAVETRIGLVGIVGIEDLRNVGQIHGTDGVLARIEEQESGQLVYVGDPVADGYHVVHAVLLDIARRHGKILRREYCGYGTDGDGIANLGGGQGILPCVLQ